MQNRLFPVSLTACLIMSVAACSGERSGDAIALNGTGLVYRGGRLQVRDVSRHTTYGLVDSPALEKWTSDDQLFHDKSPDCLILFFDVRLSGTVVEPANRHTDVVLDGDAALVRADELSLFRLNRVDVAQRMQKTGNEALSDRRVCASA